MTQIKSTQRFDIIIIMWGVFSFWTKPPDQKSQVVSSVCSVWWQQGIVRGSRPPPPRRRRFCNRRWELSASWPPCCWGNTPRSLEESAAGWGTSFVGQSSVWLGCWCIFSLSPPPHHFQSVVYACCSQSLGTPLTQMNTLDGCSTVVL